MTSRETNEPRMPSTPIVTPSDTDTVLNSIGVPPASRIPFFTHCASSRWLKLQGIVSIHSVAIPTIGRARSSSVNPTAFSMARAAARSNPSVITALLRFAGSLGRSYGFVPISPSLRVLGWTHGHGRAQRPLDLDGTPRGQARATGSPKRHHSLHEPA